jgi:hypothetical protein
MFRFLVENNMNCASCARNNCDGAVAGYDLTNVEVVLSPHELVRALDPAFCAVADVEVPAVDRNFHAALNSGARFNGRGPAQETATISSSPAAVLQPFGVT